MSAPALAFDRVSFRYPDGRVGLEELTLTIAEGERVAVLGPNGAGKSTLCLHCNGILRASEGTVSVAGEAIGQANLREVRRRVGVVFQDPDDMLFMPTVAQDVAFGPSNLGLDDAQIEQRVDEALRMVGMAEHRDRVPHHLSFGQRKRVATAAVLSMRPDILVLDEPSANLDPRGRREFGEILSGLDLTMLLVTHDLPYALSLCSRAIVIDRGRLAADGPIRGIVEDAELLAAHDLELPAGFALADFPD